MLLGYTEEQLTKLGAIHTAKEIAQQPRLWEETYQIIKTQKPVIDRFFARIAERYESVRIIFTGAGTSAFIGETIAPYVKKITDAHRFSIESIATTNIVSNPLYYLQKEMPTLMISFARSGNSPESIAAVELGEQLIDDFYHIALTCNPAGELAKKTQGQAGGLLILMPEDANDLGFAMTGSFTCMLLSALLLFDRDHLEEKAEAIRYAAATGKQIVTEKQNRMFEIAHSSFAKIVYLGSGVFCGLAREASLKMLELTGGMIPVTYDSPLGFRHGPKSIIDDDTLVVLFLSSDEYTRKYDLDILRELKSEGTKTKLLAISDWDAGEIHGLCDWHVSNQKQRSYAGDDVYLSLPYIMYAQLLAWKKSLLLGFAPDNPSPSGSVNRVVQGVTIYPFHP